MCLLEAGPPDTNPFIHIPAGGLGFVKESLSGEGLEAIGKLAIIYLFISMFWALKYRPECRFKGLVLLACFG